MRREDPCNFVFVNPIPACASHVVLFRYCEKRMQVTCEGETFVEDQGHAVVAMSWRGDDLSSNSNAVKKFPAVFEFQNQIVILGDRNVGQVLSLEGGGKWSNKINLAFEKHQLYSQVFQFLGKARMVWVKVRHKQIFDLFN